MADGGDKQEPTFQTVHLVPWLTVEISRNPRMIFIQVLVASAVHTILLARLSLLALFRTKLRGDSIVHYSKLALR